ncbi:hypothetical protein C2G38_2229757 [Gigaspora rosea]|uniref:Uncharacterized protein n=1 Tax=Gigaspora rosea TaxID=44941 RepID=A0A397U3X5_9GLOM|nr:hypothetical protein C2G38_2229757 [Gigaspora rosea]
MFTQIVIYPCIDQRVDRVTSYNLESFRTRQRIKRYDSVDGKTTSLGGRLQSYGYDTIPSHIHKHPLKDEKYFHGGYCVQKYGSRYAEHVIDAIQIELPRTLRIGNNEKRSNFILTLSESIAWFLREYYG